MTTETLDTSLIESGPDPKTINVYDRESYRKQDSREFEDVRLSSAPSYDKALITLFPYYAFVSFEVAEDLSKILSAGVHKIDMHGYPSFASVMDYTSRPETSKRGGKVFWMSGSALHMLRVVADGYEFEVENPLPFWMYTPNHRA